MAELAPATLGLVGMLGATVLAFRMPSAALVLVFATTAAYGSLQAFTGLSGAVIVDGLLIGLWASVLARRLMARRLRPLRLWPAILALALYVAVTLVAVATAPELYPALLSFRLSAWYLLAVALVAYADWDPVVYRRIARGVVAVAALVGAYACVRWLIGPAAAERDLALQVAGPYNYVDGELRTFGSFNSGHQLGFWAAAIAPFCLAAMLAWRGRWRMLAGTAFTLLALAVLASQIRGGFVALVASSILVIVVAQSVRGTRGLPVGRPAIVGVAALVLIAGGLLLTSGSGDGLSRYTRILNAEEDRAFASRTEKWQEAFDEIDEHPFGQGIGSASLNPAIREPYLSPATFALDNSYLKVAYEQGLVVMALLVSALLLLLATLLTGAVRAGSGVASAMGMGAAGTLLASLTVFYVDMAIEDVAALGPWLVVGLGSAFLVQEQSRAAARADAGAASSRRAGLAPA